MSKPSGVFRPLSLALVLAVGFGAVFALVVAGALRSGRACARDAVRESLIVRVDGTPLIQRNVYNGFHTVVTYHALDGSDVPGPKENKNENLANGSLFCQCRAGHHDAVSVGRQLSRRAIR